MVTFKNGILKVQKSDPDRFFRMPFEVCFYIGLVFYFLKESRVHYIGVALLITGSLILTAGKLYKSRINAPVLSIWYLAFIAFAELSSMWAYSPLTAALRYIKYMMLILVFCFGMVQYADTKKDVERLLDIYCCVALTIILIELIGTPSDLWFEGYFGRYVGGENSNTFGFILLYATIIAFYKSYIRNIKIWYIPIPLFIFGCILSSSRKALAMTFFGLLFMLFFAFKRKHHFFHFIFALAASAAVLIFIMNNKTFYDIIGNRIQNLIDFTTNNTSVYENGSLQMREYYVEFAKLLFSRRPIIGQGFANFATLIAAETQHAAVYAHNNYWELLADLGIIGFILYYWMYFFLLIKLIVKGFRKEFSYLQLLAITMLISEFIIEWGVISMFFIFQQTVIALMYLCTMGSDSDDKKKFYYSNSNYGGD